VIDAAFGRPAVAELASALRRSPAHLISLVALDPDPVGHVQLSRSWVDDPARLVEVAVLSPLSVAPSAQRRGVGSALIAAALAWADAHGEGYVFLEGDPGYYRTRGFEPAVPRGFSPPSVRIPAPAFQVHVLRDREVTGTVVYNDVFWRYDCVGRR
jgi:putative acetyltransferase